MGDALPHSPERRTFLYKIILYIHILNFYGDFIHAHSRYKYLYQVNYLLLIDLLLSKFYKVLNIFIKNDNKE